MPAAVATTALAAAFHSSVGWVGNAVTVAAFWISAWSLWIASVQISRSATAATAAGRAARGATAAMNRYAAAADIVRVSERIANIRRLHAARQWERAHERDQEVRLLLSDVANRHEGLSERQVTAIYTAIQTIAIVEERVGRALGDGRQPELSDDESRILINTESFLHDLESVLKARPVKGVTLNDS